MNFDKKRLRVLLGVLIGAGVGIALAVGTGNRGVGIGVGAGLAVVFAGGELLRQRAKDRNAPR